MLAQHVTSPPPQPDGTLCCGLVRVRACRGDRVERARLYKAPNERCFGVQIATNNIAEGVKAAKLAQEAGQCSCKVDTGSGARHSPNKPACL